MKNLLLALGLLTPTLMAAGEIVTEDVTYRASKVRAKGFLATPKAKGAHPGVLVVPDWWGLNAETRRRAELLAGLGYTALAVDLYGGGKRGHDPLNAGKLAGQTYNNQPELAARFKASLTYLQRRTETDPDKMAAVGYGFGGDVAVQMARNGTVGLDGVAAFHPDLKLRTPNPPIDRLSAKLLVCHAGEHVFLGFQPGAVDRFKKTMNSVKADLKFITFPDAMQGFTDPDSTKLGEKFSLPFVYDSAADTASWKELQVFLKGLWEDG